MVGNMSIRRAQSVRSPVASWQRSPNRVDKSAEKHHQKGSHPLKVALKKVHKLKNHQFSGANDAGVLGRVAVRFAKRAERQGPSI